MPIQIILYQIAFAVVTLEPVKPLASNGLLENIVAT
jgi:hypothetical protein